MKTSLLILAMLAGFTAKSQSLKPGAPEFRYPKIKASAPALSGFIPGSWILKDSVTGDLNGDGKKDIAMVIQYKDTVPERRPDKEILTGSHPRILLVVLRRGGNYALALQENTFLSRETEGGMGGDPYQKPGIEKGILEIGNQYLRGQSSYKFRYEKGVFLLIGATNAGAGANGDFEEWDFNFLSRKAKHIIGRIDSGKDKTHWRKIPHKRLKAISELGMPFLWQVFPDVYL